MSLCLISVSRVSDLIEKKLEKVRDRRNEAIKISALYKERAIEEALIKVYRGRMGCHEDKIFIGDHFVLDSSGMAFSGVLTSLIDPDDFLKHEDVPEIKEDENDPLGTYVSAVEAERAADEIILSLVKAKRTIQALNADTNLSITQADLEYLTE